MSIWLENAAFSDMLFVAKLMTTVIMPPRDNRVLNDDHFGRLFDDLVRKCKNYFNLYFEKRAEFQDSITL